MVQWQSVCFRPHELENLSPEGLLNIIYRMKCIEKEGCLIPIVIDWK